MEFTSNENGSLVLTYASVVVAEVVRAMLAGEGVAAWIDVSRVSAAVPTEVTLTVEAGLAHRARWLLQDSDLSDGELTYLATGELGGVDDGSEP